MSDEPSDELDTFLRRELAGTLLSLVNVNVHGNMELDLDNRDRDEPPASSPSSPCPGPLSGPSSPIPPHERDPGDPEMGDAHTSTSTFTGTSSNSRSDSESCDLSATNSSNSNPALGNSSSSSSSSSTERKCAVCGQSNARRCTNCNQASYCSKEHQFDHWKTHKGSCYPVKVIHLDLDQDHQIDSSITRSRTPTHALVATRNIKPGEVIFREDVILTSPGPWDSEAIEVARGRMICVSCCEIIRGADDDDLDDDEDDEAAIRCTHCKWPVCNHFCETDKRHSDQECNILTENGVSSMALNQMPDYECILVLRALLLRETDPERWMRLMNIGDGPTDICMMDNPTCWNFLNGCAKFIREKCALKQYSDGLIHKVASICYLNAFHSDDHPGENGYVYKLATYICDVASKVGHSCIGNSDWCVIPSTEDEIHLRALVPIEAGSRITITYNYKHLANAGTHQRQQFLRERYFLNCTCPRCRDPTELETYTSAVKCREEACKGYLLPVISSHGNHHHRTYSCVCGVTQNHHGWIDKLIAQISRKLELFPYKDPMRGSAKHMTETKRMVLGLKHILDKYAEKSLHPNHFILLMVEWRIMQNCYYYIMNVKHWAPEIVGLMTTLGKKHLEIFGKLSPGLSRRRGYIIYFLQTALLEAIRHGCTLLPKGAKKKMEFLEKDQTLRNTYQELMRLREEAVRIFSFKGQIQNSVESELASFSKPNQEFIAPFRFLARV